MLSFKQCRSPQEIMQLQPLFEEAVSNSIFETSRFSPKKFKRITDRVVEQKSNAAVFAGYNDEEPLGLIYCSMGELIIGSGSLITTVSLFYIKKRTRASLLSGKVATGLMAGLKSWHVSRGGSELLLHSNYGSRPSHVHSAMKRWGFATLGGSYVMRYCRSNSSNQPVSHA